MAGVDDKVVSMSFESSKFESGVNSAINALNKLKEALKFPSAGKGLDEVSASANKVDLSPIGKAIDSIKSKFSALRLVAISVMSNIVNKAVDAGLRFAKSLTIDPIVAGFKNYETQINAVQTILANTGLTGKKGLDQVNKSLDQLNTYANKTIYNFSEMAKNIGTFTAAGVDLKTSTASIKGIANLAALSGSNAQQASTAMYQLSQAIASGTVKLMDWNSVVNAGMGGKVFQKALYDTGVAMHTIKGAKVGETFDQWTKSGNSFRESLKSGWLTSKVLTTTLKGFTGDMTTAQLKAQGYTDAQIKNIQKVAKAAVGAATNIKTMTQLTDSLKEEVATAWAAIFKTIFGDINVATKLFTGIHTVAESALTTPIYKLNQLLEGWSKLGGRALLIDAIKNAFKALGAVMKPIKDAFREIFPAETAQNLVRITQAFDNFTKKLIPSPETVNNLKRTFAGLFAVLDIGKQLLGGILTVFGKVFAALAGGTGSVLKVTGGFGDFLVKVDEAIKRSGVLQKFFETLGNILATPIKMLSQLGSALTSVFSGGGAKVSGGISSAFSGMTAALTPLQSVLAQVQRAWNAFLNGFAGVAQALQPAFKAIADEFVNLGQNISTAVQNINFQGLLSVVQTGLLGGLVLIFKKFFSGNLADMLGGGIMSGITDTFDGLTGVLKNMQQTVKAATLLEIAAAVGLLTASIVAMSLIPSEKLNKAIAGVAMAMGELIGAMAVINKIPTQGFAKLPIIAASMVMLAAAVDILAIAVAKLAKLSWGQIAKGLTAVGVLLAGISISAGPLSSSSAGLIKAGIGITAIAVALNILALAIKQFGGMSWEALGKGMASVAVALGAIGLAAKLFPTGMIGIGAGLVLVAAGLKILVGVVGEFAKMSWGGIAKGMAGVAAGLLIIAGALNLMPSNMVVTAAGLLLVSIALKGITKSIESLGGQSVGAIAKGLIALAGALVILAVAMEAMQGAIGGAAALGIAAAGLALLAPALIALGKQSWGSILKGLIELAAALAILGAAGILLEPVAPALLALGAALLLIGAGLALAGAGIALIGVGLSAIAVSGPIAIGVLLKAITDFLTAIPIFVQKFITALLSIVTAIANAAPQFVAALGKILVAMAQAIIVAAPQIAKAFDALIQAALGVIVQNFPKIVDAGMQMLIALLRGIKGALPQVVAMVAQIIVVFLNSVASHIGQIISAGVNVLVKFLEGIANNLRRVVNAAGDIIASLLNGIANNLGKVINAGGNIIAKLVSGIIDQFTKVVNAGGNAIVKFINGVGDQGAKIVTAGVNAITKFINALGSAGVELANKGADAVIRFLNGVADAIRTKEPQMIAAGLNIGRAIVQGMINGIGQLAGSLTSKALSLISSLPGKVKKFLHIGSPSKVFYEIGQNIMLGLIGGIVDNTDAAVSSVEDMSVAMVTAINQVPDTLAGMEVMNPVITPVMDLTQIETGAQQMNDMINTAPTVAATTSYGQASSISAAQVPGAPGDTTGQTPALVTFEQNNYSPESLSEIDIYRQTKNQLSLLKSSLAVS